MRFMQSVSIAILAMVLTTACQSESSQPVLLEQPTPYPTYTLYPTYTPYPTFTPLPTASQKSLPSDELEELIWPTGPRDDVIPFEDAADFIGEKITVEGTIARTHNSGNAVFLNFSDGSEDGFTAVIFSDDWPKFPSPPENLFAGKLVRIEGVIEEYQGIPEIIINNPAQIEVALTLGQPVITDCSCEQQTSSSFTPATATSVPTSTQMPTTTPEATTDSPTPETPPTPADTQPQIVSWDDAATYDGQNVTVAGQVVDTYNSGKVVFLNFDEDFRNTFKVAIFADAWSLFPAPPENYYRGKMVHVTGQIKMYQNAPEIIVDHPEQIKVVEQ